VVYVPERGFGAFHRHVVARPAAILRPHGQWPFPVTR
jgi:hypothetical protein